VELAVRLDHLRDPPVDRDTFCKDVSVGAVSTDIHDTMRYINLGID